MKYKEYKAKGERYKNYPVIKILLLMIKYTYLFSYMIWCYTLHCYTPVQSDGGDGESGHEHGDGGQQRHGLAEGGHRVPGPEAAGESAY